MSGGVTRPVQRVNAISAARAIAHVGLAVVVLSGCVTTVATSPMTVMAHAGLPPRAVADMWTGEGVVTVDGSTDVTLHVIGEKTTTYRLRLSSLRNEGGKLLLLDTGERIDLTDISSTEVTVPSPSRNLELVLGITAVTAVMVALAFLAEGIAWSQSRPFQ